MKTKEYSLANCINQVLKDRIEAKPVKESDPKNPINRKEIILKSTLIRLKDSEEVNLSLVSELEKLGINFKYIPIYEPLTQYRIYRDDYSENAPDNIDIELDCLANDSLCFDAGDIAGIKQAIRNEEDIPQSHRISDVTDIRKSVVLGTKPEETFYWIHYIMLFSKGGQQIAFYSEKLRKELNLPACENETERAERLGDSFNEGGIAYKHYKFKKKYSFTKPIRYNM